LIFKLIFTRQLWRKFQTDRNSAILVRGAIGSFVVKVLGAATAFALHILLARLLGVTQYGIYVYALTCVNILVIISLLGLNNSLVRFAAAYKAQQKWGLLRGIFRRSTQAVVVFSFLSSLIGGIIVWCLRNHFSHDQLITSYVALVLLPIFSLAKLQEVGLRAIKLVVKSNLLLEVIRPLLLAAILIAFYLCLRQPIFAIQAMTINLIAVIATFVTGRLWLIKALPHSVREIRPLYADKKWLKVSLPLLFLAGASLVLNRTDIIMLGAILGSSKAGIYAVASRVASLVIFGLLATNAIVAPMISELYHTGKNDELQRIVTLAARGIFAFTVVVSIALAISGRYLLSLFGREFVVAYTPLLILLGGQLINALAGPVGFLMIMTDHQNQAGLIVGVSAAVNIVLNALLIPRIGLSGAAVSTAFTMVLWNMAMLFYVKRKLGISPTIITIR